MRISISYFSIVFAILVLSACSQKTSAPAATAQGSSTQADKRGSGERKGKRERPKFADLLSKMDVDKDGKLSVTEVDDRLKERFPTMDTNQDGFLAEEEFKNAPRPKRGRRGGERPN